MVNVESLLEKYSFAVTAGKLKLHSEIALRHQKWIRLKNESNVVSLPEIAVTASKACD